MAGNKVTAYGPHVDTVAELARGIADVHAGRPAKDKLPAAVNAAGALRQRNRQRTAFGLSAARDFLPAGPSSSITTKSSVATPAAFAIRPRRPPDPWSRPCNRARWPASCRAADMGTLASPWSSRIPAPPRRMGDRVH